MSQRIRYQLFSRIFALPFRRRSGGTVRHPIRQIAFIRPGKLGDMLVATPLFSQCRNRLNVDQVIVVGSRYNEIVVRHNPFVDIVKAIDFHSIAQVARLTAWLRRQHVDAIVDLTPGISNTNFLISQVAGTSSTLGGLHKRFLSPYYDFVHTDDTGHLVDQNIGLLKMLTGAETEKPSLSIYSSPSDKENASAFLGGILRARERRRTCLIGVNLSAGAPARQWKQQHYAALLGILGSNKQLKNPEVILFSVGAQEEWARQLCSAYAFAYQAPSAGLLTTSEIVGRMDLFISPDTSLVPIACSHGVPVVGLYLDHKETLTRWGPYGVPHRFVVPEGENRFDNIRPESVALAARELLSETRTLPDHPSRRGAI